MTPAADPRILTQLAAFDQRVHHFGQALAAGRRKEKQLDAGLVEVAAEFDEARNKVQEAKLQIRKAELEIEDLRRQAKLHHGHLNEISDSREYRALNDEIRYIHRQAENKEEEVLAIMEENEKSEAALAEVEERLKTQREECAQAKSQLLAERARQEQDLAQATDHRNRFLEQMPAPTRKFYERMARRMDMPIVWLWQEACSYCQHRLTPQSLLEVRRGSNIVVCESCGRVVVAAADEVAPSASEMR